MHVKKIHSAYFFLSLLPHTTVSNKTDQDVFNVNMLHGIYDLLYSGNICTIVFVNHLRKMVLFIYYV